MRYSVVAVGKAKAPYLDDLQHYSKLLSRYARVDVIEVADDEALQRRIPERAWVCLLDSRGKSFTSEAFAGWLEERRQAGRDVAFVIGGAFGIGESLRSRASSSLSLAPWTLPHELARLVLAEQLYRAGTIVRREPYHK